MFSLRADCLWHKLTVVGHGGGEGGPTISNFAQLVADFESPQPAKSKLKLNSPFSRLSSWKHSTIESAHKKARGFKFKSLNLFSSRAFKKRVGNAHFFAVSVAIADLRTKIKDENPSALCRVTHSNRIGMRSLLVSSNYFPKIAPECDNNFGWLLSISWKTCVPKSDQTAESKTNQSSHCDISMST
jgi:hypothetical protein